MDRSIPWRSDESAIAWLQGIAEVAAGAPAPPVEPPDDAASAARWILERDLVAPAFAWARDADPELASRLRPHALGSAAANLVHRESVVRIERRFAAERVEMVLLKGAATAEWVYPDPSLRPMTDVDVWVAAEAMDMASVLLDEIGFRRDPGLAGRPDALQRESGGERIFVAADGSSARVELHYSPFQGWWTRRTASPDARAVWLRAVPIAEGRHARRLCAEDAVIQAAVHAVVGQFSQAPLRGLLDVAVLARRARVEWRRVAARAERWRLRVAVWLALDLADRVFGVPGGRAAIDSLRPRATRRAILGRFVDPAALLRGADLTPFHLRNPFLFAVTDRAPDAARLAGRTLWPEDWWLEARYGRPTGRFRHIRAMIRDRGA